MKAGESLPDQGRAEGPPSAHGSTVPGTEKPPWSAEWRASFAKDADAARRRTNGCATRRSIPLTFVRDGKRKTAYPAPVKNTGDDARLLVIPGREP